MYNYEDSYEETGIDENVVQDALFGMLCGDWDTALEILPGPSTFRGRCDEQRHGLVLPPARQLRVSRSPSCRAGDTARLTMALGTGREALTQIRASRKPHRFQTANIQQEAISHVHHLRFQIRRPPARRGHHPRHVPE